MTAPFRMANIDGSGDDECRNGIDWIGRPVAGGCDTATSEVAVGAPDDGCTASADESDGEGKISEITGPDAGIPPYPGMPRSRGWEYGRGGVADGPGRPSTAVNRRETSPS